MVSRSLGLFQYEVNKWPKLQVSSCQKNLVAGFTIQHAQNNMLPDTMICLVCSCLGLLKWVAGGCLYVFHFLADYVVISICKGYPCYSLDNRQVHHSNAQLVTAVD